MSDGVRFHRLGPPLLVALLIAVPVQAQIVTDGSVGPKVSLRGGEIEIGADLGSRRGDNLFHSFEKFGKLGSTVGQADLYFLNPAGVVFGPNAQLDVPGSFHVSTAHELRFAGGARFSALDKTGSGLTVAPPEAFGFLDKPLGRIAVDQSQLQLDPGKTLSLVGGDLTVDGGETGGIGVEDGKVHLVSAAGPGGVRIADAATAVSQQGDIRVSQHIPEGGSNLAVTDVSGPNGGGMIRIRGGRLSLDGAQIFADNYGTQASTGGVDLQTDHLAMRNSLITSDTFGSGKAGTVAVIARELELHGGQIASTTFEDGDAGRVTVTADRLGIHDSVIASGTFGSGNAGQVTVNADRLLISDINAAGTPSHISSSAEPGATGRAGTVAVTTRELELRNGGFIFSSTFGPGDAGQITVNADRLLISGNVAAGFTGIASSAEPGSTGQAGTVAVTARELELRNVGGQISTGTWGPGDAGQITVNADRLLVAAGSAIISSAQVGSTGRAGTIAVTARELELRGGQIDSSTFENGDAGHVTVTAHEMKLHGGGVIASSTFGSGNAGQVTVSADHLLVSPDGAAAFTGIVSSASRGSTGHAGTVAVTARELELRNGGQIHTATIGPGNAGQVEVQADRLLVPGGLIGSTTEPGATGRAGTVAVTTRELELRNGGQIVSGTSGSGNAGQVAVNADERLLVTGVNAAGYSSMITSSAQPGSTGQGGTVAVTASELELDDGGQITSDTWGPGDAGQVEVWADRLLVSGIGATGYSSGIFSSAITGSTGAGGAVTVQARSLLLQDQGVVSTQSDGTGPGGPILISAADTLRLDHAEIRAKTETAKGGDVTLSVGRLFDVHNSAVTTSVAGGTGSGGNIFINPHLMVLDNSRIEANAQRGSGGDITIRAGQLINTPDSVIEASSAESVSGTITIAAPNTDVAGSLVVLPETFFDVSSQLRETCAARGGRPASSFTAGGRGGLPPDPGAPLAASPFGQPPGQQTATGAPTTLTAKPQQAVNPITIAGIPQPVLGSPRLTCRG
jgi:large exoprotein involved in heme utilization and adhesion